MNADTILACTQYTYRNSIGVIGGWFYNSELKDKLGLTTDFVKQGNHVDLGFGFSLPFINQVILPDRNLDEEEMSKIKSSMLSMYKNLNKIAAGRKMDMEK